VAIRCAPARAAPARAATNPTPVERETESPSPVSHSTTRPLGYPTNRPPDQPATRSQPSLPAAARYVPDDVTRAMSSPVARGARALSLLPPSLAGDPTADPGCSPATMRGRSRRTARSRWRGSRAPYRTWRVVVGVHSFAMRASTSSSARIRRSWRRLLVKSPRVRSRTPRSWSTRRRSPPVMAFGKSKVTNIS